MHHVRNNSIPKTQKSRHVKDALKKHGNQNPKLDAIEEASVELMSSSANISYNFGQGDEDNNDDNACDEKDSKLTEMHTIDEVNGISQPTKSSTDSTDDTATSNSSEAVSDGSDTVFYQRRTASLYMSRTIPRDTKVIFNGLFWTIVISYDFASYLYSYT